jgi:hypothetical protein
VFIAFAPLTCCSLLSVQDVDTTLYQALMEQMSLAFDGYQILEVMQGNNKLHSTDHDTLNSTVRCVLKKKSGLILSVTLGLPLPAGRQGKKRQQLVTSGAGAGSAAPGLIKGAILATVPNWVA